MMADRKSHWEKIFNRMASSEVSWHKPHLSISLQLIERFGIGASACLIDVGGGDSTLVDDLLERGCTNVTVLDITQAALDRARLRLGDRAQSVTWLNAEITQTELAANSDGGLTLLAASVPVEEFREFRKNAEEKLRQELEAMPQIVERLRRAERVGPVKGSGNIPGYQRVSYGSGWVLAGDAEHLLNPWSRQGIDQASTHASILADALNRYLTHSVSWDSAVQEYNRRRREFSDKTFERTCTYARDFRPMTAAALKKRGLIH